jgi:hypothetical protein
MTTGERSETTMTKAEQFFYDNAGYSYGIGENPETGRRRCAREMAKAEQFAKDARLKAEWRRDYDADPDDWDGDGPLGTKAYWCALYTLDHRHTSASLCGIWDPTPEYRRVVETELASEVMYEWRKAYQLPAVS